MMFKLTGTAVLIASTLVVTAISSAPFSGETVRIVFDLPETVECRDVTPADFAAAHPSLKVIEAKFRISARMISGSESDLLDVLYIIASPDQKMRFQDYLPNTAIESVTADDQIEITDTTENAKGGEIGARVGYEGVGGGVSRTRSTKQTHSTHYKQIAPRALVVASGTTDHEHGVFFKLKPSRAAVLEGAKDFTFLATVPKSWRGGWCTISCAARATTKTLFYRSEIVPAGVAQSQIGLYLSGDTEANQRADELGAVQRQHADALDNHLARGGLLETMYDSVVSGHTTPLCDYLQTPSARRASDEARLKLEAAQQAVREAQHSLQLLSR